MQFSLAYRFNRYIVECKVVNMAIAQLNSARFNRYIVECKGKRKKIAIGRKD